ncbi:MAG: hypothetical protein ACIARR_08520 [Phycisphaerales bacterium JB059]
MLDPAPTTKIDPTLARGRVEEIHEATATKPAYVVLSFPNTMYRTHLVPGSPLEALAERAGKTVIGRISAKARRVDKVGAGGRYIEPVAGRPRRVQGAVIATDPSKNTITVNAGAPLTCALTDKRQKASDFDLGDFVSFGVEPGATFTLDG